MFWTASLSGNGIARFAFPAPDLRGGKETRSWVSSQVLMTMIVRTLLMRGQWINKRMTFTRNRSSRLIMKRKSQTAPRIILVYTFLFEQLGSEDHPSPCFGLADIDTPILVIKR